MMYLVSSLDDTLSEIQAKTVCPHTQKIKLLPKNGIVVNGHYIGNSELDDAYAKGYRYAYKLL